VCGICGIAYSDRARRVEPRLLDGMLKTIVHRGPDESGTHIAGNVGLGLQRLSIIDLASGKQPLSNEDGTVWITFNGEIYNYQELRSELMSKGHRFATRSDTEAIVHLYEEHGEACVEKLRGMFAFAIWDSVRNKLFLARDRLGIKPLYYAFVPTGLVFSSEIKAILTHPGVARELDRDSLRLYLTFRYTPGKKTLFKGIWKLRPGHSAVWQDGKLTDKQYWDLAPYYHSNGAAPRRPLEELDAILDESVRLHLISDVPVGFLLSGGVDSSALLDIACRQSGAERLKCFTMGFSSESFADERYYAHLAADRLGVECYDITISGDEFVRELPRFVWHAEEPICEPPAIALYFVSKLASEHVKVVLSGEGGDEAFAGYQNYRNSLLFERAKAFLGPRGRRMAARFLGGSQDLRVRRYLGLLETPLESYYYSRTSSPVSLFSRLSGELVSSDDGESEESWTAEQIVGQYLGRVSEEHLLNKMLYVDTMTWLPDDLLLKADKMSMANSLELRVPLLDHVVMQFAAALRPRDKVRGLTTKYILKKALRGRVPQQILNRRKTGFPVPYERWMTERSDVVWGVLRDRRTMERGYFDSSVLRGKLFDKLVQSPGLSKELFSMFILEIWARTFLDGERVTLN
jgi:asparagine synthase (glutamine-hydrolysing)